MEKFEILSLVAVIFLLATPMVSYAETGQECAANCVNKCSVFGSGKTYETCLENCLKGCYGNPPQKRSEINSSKFFAEVNTENENMITNVVVASAKRRDGSACSGNGECSSGVCEGGSCCTAHGDPCNLASHCCGHPSQGCTNGTCP